MALAAGEDNNAVKDTPVPNGEGVWDELTLMVVGPGVTTTVKGAELLPL